MLFYIFLIFYLLYSTLFPVVVGFVDCSTRDSLIDPNNPSDSVLIQSFYDAFNSKGASPAYRFKWGPTLWKQWTAILTEKFEPLIGDGSLTNEEKHSKIYGLSIKFIENKVANNKSYVLCVPEPNWGYFGDYLQCQIQIAGISPPAFSLDCNEWCESKKHLQRKFKRDILPKRLFEL